MSDMRLLAARRIVRRAVAWRRYRVLRPNNPSPRSARRRLRARLCTGAWWRSGGSWVSAAVARLVRPARRGRVGPWSGRRPV